jgi:hypothetical protein
MGWTCGTYGGEESCIRALVWEAEGRRPLERPRRRWEDNIKMDLREFGRERWRALVYTVMSLRVP